jgi:UDP-glucose 4-epimerase
MKAGFRGGYAMAVLVTGGAGYIGSHTVAALLEKGEEVVILDNLYQGRRDAVLGGKLYEGDLMDGELLDRIFAAHDIDGVIHFAAFSLVGESMRDPGKYYRNNVYGTLCLLEAMKKAGVSRIVFSSTAAVYGEPERVPIDEGDRTLPTNVYGETKLAMEKMIRWFGDIHGIRSVSLRYFNAAGAHENGRIGEDHRPETHLIPLILQVALGKRDFIAVFGNDYPTEDGTCIRDYIHVSDLADAHILALERLRAGGGSAVYNLGTGNGYSVQQVIAAAREVTGHPIPARVEPRRAGDPAVLVASSARAQAELGWTPRRSDLHHLIATAWEWHRRHPDGYAQ